jgi:hypothetical protein
VSEAARTTLVEHIGGDAVLIPNGVATRRYRKAEPLPGWPGPAARSASWAGWTSPQGPVRAAQGVRDPRPGATGAAAARRRPGATPTRCCTRCPPSCGTGWSARAGQRGGQGPRAALGGRVLLAEHRRRVVRHRDRRGDGGRRARRGQRHRRVPAGAARRRGGRAVRRPATRPTWPGRPGACSTTRRGAPSSPPRRWPRWPTTTGRWSPATCSACTRRSSSAAPRSRSPRPATDFGDRPDDHRHRHRMGNRGVITDIVIVVAAALLIGVYVSWRAGRIDRCTPGSRWRAPRWT